MSRSDNAPSNNAEKEIFSDIFENILIHKLSIDQEDIDCTGGVAADFFEGLHRKTKHPGERREGSNIQ